MDVLSLTFPEIVRKKKSLFLYLKMEQEGERMHKRLNELDQKYLNVKNVGEKFFLMIRDLGQDPKKILRDGI